jgi:formate hydrogenlyase transcriptional activator
VCALAIARLGWALRMVDTAGIDAFVQSSPYPAWLASGKGECVCANPALARLTGRNSDQINQADWRSFLFEEDREAASASWEGSIATGTPYRMRVRLQRFDGQPETVELIAFGHQVSERTELWLFTGLPVHGQQQHPPVEAHLQTTLNVIPAFVWYAAPHGALSFVNQRCADYLGLPKDHPFRFGIDVGAEWDAHIQFLHPDDREATRKVWSTCLSTGRAGEVSFRVCNSEGAYRWFLSRAEPLRANDGTLLYWMGVNFDIEELKHAEFYLAEGQRLGHMGSWVWQVGGKDALHLSEEWYRIFGFDPKVEMPRWEERLQRVHPEDRDKWQGTIERAIRERSDYDVEFRILLPDGTIKWVQTVGHPVLSTAGELVQFVGSSMDVTERKASEERIRGQEAELRQVLDITPQHVHVLTADANLIYTNEVARQFHGDALDDWRGRPLHQWRIDELPIMLFHPDDRERVMNELRSKLSSESPHETEARLVGYDGKYRWFLFRYNPLRDEQGRVVRWYVAGTDIEDRKQTEERLQHENVALREELDNTCMFEEIVGTSHALQAVLSRVSKVAPTDSTVLITGETGTGKELIARAIHRRSGRASRAFVSVNCAAIPRDLIASELFGHEKGSFTGATQQRLGRFELAGGGTIFLDEVGELPAGTQIALLRVLQEHEFERVGGTRSIQTDVRVIAATNRDLPAAIASGSFRSDLFYRLNVFPIEAPSLRERREDIPMLVEYFIDRFARKTGKSISQVSKRTLDLLQAYRWPGNIRELQNVIERSVILCETENFSVDESWLSRQPLASEPKSRLELSQTLAAQEKELIEAALRECEGRVFGPSGAAAKLGIPRSTLESKIRSLKINKNRFKTADPSKNI